MTTILQLNSSLFTEGSQSTRLADEFVTRLHEKHSNAWVIRRDLGASPLPHLDEQTFRAAITALDQRTPAQSRAAALADQLIAELQAADILVIGAPMYNFGIPSTLKAWFDHVGRAGTTFRYTANGPEGLLHNKKAFLFMTRGGKYAGTPADVMTPHIRQFLQLIGINDIEFIFAEGLALGEESGRQAIDSANHLIEKLAA